MTDGEKISRIIDLVELGNAKRFADACGIDPAVVSKIRRGKGTVSFYFPRILKAYPDVREEWLRDGEGLPLRSMTFRDELSAKIDRWSAEIEEYKEMVSHLTSLVEEMRKDMKKAGKVPTKVPTPRT